MKYQLIIIGGGPAGLAAAYSAWSNGLRSVLIIERDKYLGGILNQCIHNGFGLHYFKSELTGPEYAGRFIDMLTGTGVDIMSDTMVLRLDPDKNVHVVSSSLGYQIISAEAVILAMGCRERARGAVAIPGARPSGIFTAGTAQLYMNIYGMSVGKRIVIRGTGDIGLIMARRFTLEGAKVLACIGASDHPDGLTRNVVQCLEDFNIPLLLRHTITDVRGSGRVEQVTAMAVDEQRKPIPGTDQVFDCDTLLLSVGLIPENELTRQAGIKMDPRTGGAVVYDNMETSISGIFACGNVVQVHDLVDYVTAESLKAGAAAAEYVQSGPRDSLGALPVLAGSGVGYTVPMYIRTDCLSKPVNISFRVRKAYGASSIEVKQGETLLAHFRRRSMCPAGMESIAIPPALLSKLTPGGGALTVSAVEEKVEEA